ncbi:dual specificity protein kinase yak1, partial [Ceratobasidium sp. UAMH 11750]
MFAVVIKKESPERPLGHIPDNSTRGNKLWPLLKRCWAFEPGDRPGAAEVRDIMQEMTQKRATQVYRNATSESPVKTLPKVNAPSQGLPSRQPDNTAPGDSGSPAASDAHLPRTSSRYYTSRSARHGFRPVRDPKICNHVSTSTQLPVRSLTTHIIQTYHLCNPKFHYESTRNPRRPLIQPDKPIHNDGFDNENHDYILYVNDILGPGDGSNKYLVLNDLGKGECSWVAKCQDVRSHEVVAIKVIKNKPAYFNQGMTEIAILELLNARDPSDEHHMVRLRDTFIQKNHICLVFELLSVSLRELNRQASPGQIGPALVSAFTSQLLDALAVLNEARIIHRDLKPENILLNLKTPRIKIIDFGSACHERQAVETDIQSLAYCSPEMLFGVPYDSAIDIWSLGCIAVELAINQSLFS